MNRENVRWMLLATALLGPFKLISAPVIRGSVTDVSGAAISGATIQLSSGTRVLAEAVTTSSGDFLLSLEQPDGTYTIMAAASGFAPTLRSVRLPRADNPALVLVLEVAPYRQAIEIHAATPDNTSILDMSGVRESPAKDVGEALTALDGVWKIRKAGIANDLVIRGFQQNNINVLVDGSRTYGACPSHMDPPAQHVDFAEVDHIEVTKGAFDVTNQGSLGAVVNIVTRSPGMGFSLKPSFSMGSFGLFNPSITTSYGNRTIRLLGGYSYRTSDPYRDGSGRRFTDNAPYSAAGRQQRSFDINTGWIEAAVSLSQNQEVSLGYTRQQAGLILYPYLSMDSDFDNADRGTFRYSGRELSPGIRALRVEGYFTQVKHFMSDSQRASAMMGNWMMAADASTRAIGGRVEADLGRDLTAGIETYDRNWDVLGYMKMGGAVTGNPSVPDVGTRTAGAFLSYRRALGENVNLSAGMRFDHATMRVGTAQASTNLYYQFHDTRRVANSDNYGSGNTRLSIALPGSSEFFVGAGTTGRIPDAEERYISRGGMGAGTTVGNPLLPITRNTELTAGWSMNRTPFYLRPAFFHSFLNDYIVVNNQPQVNMPGGGSMRGMNMAAPASARSFTNIEARIYGGEVTYGATLTNTLSLSGGGSYSRGTARPSRAVNVTSSNLPEMPPLRGWASLRYVRTWAFAEVGAMAVNRQSLVSADLREQPTPGYGLLNLKLGVTRGKVSASLAVDNLLNRFYYEHLSYFRDPFAAGVKLPEPGRNFFVQLRYSL